MKKHGALLLAAISVSLALTSCMKEKDEEGSTTIPLTKQTAAVRIGDTPEWDEWILPQTGRTLSISAEEPFDCPLNPFAEVTDSSVTVLSLIFSAPLHEDGTPWGGTVTSAENPDGTVTATVRIRDNMLFSDGEPVMIDDYIYGFYVAADPTMKGYVTNMVEGVQGTDEYRSDLPDWEAMREKAREKAEALYSPDIIFQEDYEKYLIGSRLEGTFDDKSLDEWKEYAEKEGFGDDWSGIDSSNPDEVLSLIAVIEMAEHYKEWDPVSWWAEQYFNEMLITEKKEEVPFISGIRKIDDLTCTITFRDRESYSLDRVNRPFIPAHWYSAFRKGELMEVLGTDMPLGSGPYRIKSLSPERVRLEANPLYFEGMPVIGNIELVHGSTFSDMPIAPTREDMERLFIEESLETAIPEGTDMMPVLWKLRLK